jgi:hypothetical protein
MWKIAKIRPYFFYFYYYYLPLVALTQRTVSHLCCKILCLQRFEKLPLVQRRSYRPKIEDRTGESLSRSKNDHHLFSREFAPGGKRSHDQAHTKQAHYFPSYKISLLCLWWSWKVLHIFLWHPVSFIRKSLIIW